MKSDIPRNGFVREPSIFLGPDRVKIIAKTDEFKGKWAVLKTLSSARLDRERANQDADAELPLLSLKVVRLLHEHQRLTISAMVKHSAANQNTIKVRLRELVNAGRIRRHGKGRASWYLL